jgi:membrane-associated protease RseP (regulator of RpoE activity)
VLEPEFTRSEHALGTMSVPALRYSLPHRWWVNLLLFAVTLLTSTAFGSAVVETFRTGQPLSFDVIVTAYGRLLHMDPALWSGWQFSVPLLLILLAHELGHYVECVRRGVSASLPFFLPSPFLFGTFGALIRMRSPIYARAALFDIGIGGPVAGFVTLVPFLVGGVMLSKVTPPLNVHDAYLFGTPLAMRLMEWVRFPGVPPAEIALHPMARAAWVGLFATALNLLPIGQLDGGHIVYAIGRDVWHTRITMASLVVVALLGYFYLPWLAWSAILFFFGRRHPLVYDNEPLSPKRLLLCIAALLMFVLSVSITPVRTA